MDQVRDITDRREAESRARKVNAVLEGLRDQGQRLSYGATKTVLDRLVKKQVLTRTMAANQYTYRACLDRSEFERSAIREIVDGLFSGFGEPVIAQFLHRIRAVSYTHLTLPTSDLV